MRNAWLFLRNRFSPFCTFIWIFVLCRILKIYQSGLTQRYFSNYLKGVVVTCTKVKKKYHDDLGLKELRFLYVYYFWFIVIALILCLMEIIYKKYSHNQINIHWKIVRTWMNCHLETKCLKVAKNVNEFIFTLYNYLFSVQYKFVIMMEWRKHLLHGIDC